MTNLKLLKYELKQIILSKKYFYITLILILCALKSLSSLISPWNNVDLLSKWSYYNFLADNNCFFITFTVLFCISTFSQNENKVKNIIFSTTFSEKGYYRIKQLSIFLSILIPMFILMLIHYAWYSHYINDYIKINPFSPILTLSIPAIIFILGLSMNIGKLSTKALYVFLPIIFLLTSLNIGLPVWMDIAGNNTLYEITTFCCNPLPNKLPVDFICSRIIMLVIGITLIVLACRKSRK